MATTVYRAAIALTVLGSSFLAQAQDVIEQQCDPRISHRFEACPDGYCCVRDEFLPSWVYCKKLGQAREGCTTRDSETNCPCSQDLVCKPNIVSSSGTASLYGKCEVAPTTTTTTAPTTTTTTTTSASADTTTTAPNLDSTAAVVTPCPHGHSCEEHGHHHTHVPHDHGHITQEPAIVG